MTSVSTHLHLWLDLKAVGNSNKNTFVTLRFLFIDSDRNITWQKKKKFEAVRRLYHPQPHLASLISPPPLLLQSNVAPGPAAD